MDDVDEVDEVDEVDDVEEEAPFSGLSLCQSGKRPGLQYSRRAARATPEFQSEVKFRIFESGSTAWGWVIYLGSFSFFLHPNSLSSILFCYSRKRGF